MSRATSRWSPQAGWGRRRPTAGSRRTLLDALRADGIPALGVSYGGNDPAEAEMPVDWGTSIPLSFMAADRIVVVSPARDRPLAEHVRAGAAIAQATARPARRADRERRPRPRARRGGPYGFDPAAAEYDAQVQAILGSGRLDFEPLAALVVDAKADSLWQLLVLQGAVGAEAEVDLLAYAAPTYFGMLCAEVRP